MFLFFFFKQKTAYERRISDCSSDVCSSDLEKRDGQLLFHAVSDAAIVSGIIAVLLRIYSDRTPREIVATEPDFIAATGLDEHLAMTRKNGLGAMQNVRAPCR